MGVGDSTIPTTAKGRGNGVRDKQKEGPRVAKAREHTPGGKARETRAKARAREQKELRWQSPVTTVVSRGTWQESVLTPGRTKGTAPSVVTMGTRPSTASTTHNNCKK